MPPLLANALGWMIAFLVSFAGHYWLTFRHTAQPIGMAIRRFFTISAITFCVNEASYSWLLRTTRLRYDVLLALILIAVACMTFLASRLWAFRRRHAP
jgi:putative flippase GtrA